MCGLIMPTITYDQFIVLVYYFYDHGDSKNYAPAKRIRKYGQVLMNKLHEVWPKKHAEIIGTKYDCFHDDSLVEVTHTKLKKEWNNI